MTSRIDKFISSAESNDKTALKSYLGGTVKHPVFGAGRLVKIDYRELTDGPLFRMTFQEYGAKEFNLDSIREGYITDVEPGTGSFDAQEADTNQEDFEDMASD